MTADSKIFLVKKPLGKASSKEDDFYQWLDYKKRRGDIQDFIEISPSLEQTFREKVNELLSNHGILSDGFLVCCGHCCDYHNTRIEEWFFQKLRESVK